MGRPVGWMVTQTGRPAMRSPGRPPVRRDVERVFWVKIAEGLSSEDAAVACGVSGRRAQSACSKASRARSVRSECDTRQPTMNREYASITNAT